MELVCDMYNLELNFYSQLNIKTNKFGNHPKRKFKILQINDSHDVALILNFWECSRYGYVTVTKKRNIPKLDEPEEKRFVLPQLKIPAV